MDVCGTPCTRVGNCERILNRHTLGVIETFSQTRVRFVCSLTERVTDKRVSDLEDRSQGLRKGVEVEVRERVLTDELEGKYVNTLGVLCGGVRVWDTTLDLTFYYSFS